jgi:ATP/maltotriose-dependent transcriptional regulator MalT
VESDDVLDRARSAYAEKAWDRARDGFEESGRLSPLGHQDLHRLAVSSFMNGQGDSVDAWARAHALALDEGDPESAVRYAFWSGFVLSNRGMQAQAGGWLARALKLLPELSADSPAHGLVLLPEAVGALHSGQFVEAVERFRSAGEVGDRTRDADVQTLAALGRGQALVGLGRPEEGLSLLDEAMLTVTSLDVSPLICGLVYCATISTCYEMFDVRRAQEWTEALTAWCDSQAGIVPFRGQCMVHRSELMQLHGAWPAALDEIRQAIDRLLDPPGQFAIGDAYYQLGELHRVSGRPEAAEEAYRKANEWGKTPQPGLALLRVSQGRAADGLASLRRVLDTASPHLTRLGELAAYVEVALEVGDVQEARRAVDELRGSAQAFDTLLVTAMCATADGAVLLREGQSRAACETLQTATASWRELEVPSEIARARVLLGQACRELDDVDTADLELAAARSTFEALGALPDVDRVDRLSGRAQSTEGAAYPDGLTGREVEVLRLVASGATNREIAAELVISEKTVARHLSNIFGKIAVPSRAAATAYAYEKHLVTTG